MTDAVFDSRDGRLLALVIPGRSRFFGLFGREEDTVLPWNAICRMGEDIILTDGVAFSIQSEISTLNRDSYQPLASSHLLHLCSVVAEAPSCESWGALPQSTCLASFVIQLKGDLI